MREKKDSRKKDSLQNKEQDLGPKIPGLSARAFAVIKFILGIFLLPFVYSLSVAFVQESETIPFAQQNYFWAGIISLLVIYLFIWEPASIYLKGQRLLEIVFSFFRPLVKVAPYLFPIYALILFIIYLILSPIVKSADLINYFIFLFGVSLSLHLVFSAKSLRSKQEDFLKANYIFGFSFVYILNILFVAFCFNFLFEKFSLVNFANQSFQTARNIFGAVIRQLFLR